MDRVTSRNALHPMLGNDTRKSSRKRKASYTEEPEQEIEDKVISPPTVKKAKRKKKKPVLKSSTKGGRWTYDEKKKFLNGVIKFGRGKWSSIAQDIPTRTVVQVKTHAQSLFKRYKEVQDLKEFVKEELELIEKEIDMQKKQDVPLTPTRRETQSIVSNDEVKQEDTKQARTKAKQSQEQKLEDGLPLETIHIPASLEITEDSMAVFDNISMSCHEIQDPTQAQEAPPTPTLPQNYQHLAYPTHANYGQPVVFSPMLSRHMPPTPASYYQKLNLHGEPNAMVDAKMFDESFQEQGFDDGQDLHGQGLQHHQDQDIQVDMEEVNQSFHLWMQQEHGGDEDAEKDMKQEHGFTWPETLLPLQNGKLTQQFQNEVIPMEVQLEPQLPIPMEVQCEPQLPFSFMGASSNLANHPSPLRMALKLSPRHKLSPRKLSPKKQPNLPLPLFSSPPSMNFVSATVPIATPSVATPGTNLTTPPSAASTYLMNTFSKGKGMAQKNLTEMKTKQYPKEKCHPTTLATQQDVTRGNLNSLHQYVRSELLEICLASEKESCGKQKMYAKRVGFQCVHCAKAADGDVLPASSRFFPKSLDQIYRSVCTWQRVHFPNCKHTPVAVKQYYTHLKMSDKTKGRTAYWVEAAKTIGLKDNDFEQGIIFS